MTTGNSALTRIFDEIDLWGLDARAPLVATDTLLSVSYENGEMIVELAGNFEYGDGPLPVSGTITSLEFLEGEDVELRETGLSVSVEDFLPAC